MLAKLFGGKKVLRDGEKYFVFENKVIGLFWLIAEGSLKRGEIGCAIEAYKTSRCFVGAQTSVWSMRDYQSLEYVRYYASLCLICKKKFYRDWLRLRTSMEYLRRSMEGEKK